MAIRHVVAKKRKIAHVSIKAQRGIKAYQALVAAVLRPWLSPQLGWGQFLDDPHEIDALTVDFDERRLQFAVLHRSQATTALVLVAAIRLKQYVGASPIVGLRPLVVVPYMGDAGAKTCADAEVDWLDLSGNASITAPGIRLERRGRPNKFKRSGRPSSVFSPRSSRLVRQLLLESDGLERHDLVRSSGLDEGYASRVLGKMRDEGVILVEGNRLRLVDRLAMLDAWRSEYEFLELVHVRKGHLSVESGQTLAVLAERLNETCDYAMTGLGAAALMTGFGNHRLVTSFVASAPDDAMLRSLGIRPEERGANVWLAQPKDDAVFWGAHTLEGSSVRCAAKLQVYLDLKAQPERAEEATTAIREELKRQWQ